MRSVPGVASRSGIVLGQPTAHRPRRCRSAAPWVPPRGAGGLTVTRTLATAARHIGSGWTRPRHTRRPRPPTTTSASPTTAAPTCATTDWYGSLEPGSDPAITAPYRDRPNNVQDHTPVNVYYRAVALDPGKTVAVVILPRISGGVSADIPSLHVFGIGIG